jgi:hypothetical protein
MVASVGTSTYVSLLKSVIFLRRMLEGQDMLMSLKGRLNEKKVWPLMGKDEKGTVWTRKFWAGTVAKVETCRVGMRSVRRNIQITDKLTPLLFQRHQQKGWEIQANKRMMKYILYFIHSSEIGSFHGLYRKLCFKCVINLATMCSMTGVYFGHVFKNFVVVEISGLHTLILCCNIRTYRVHSLRRFLGQGHFPQRSIRTWVYPKYSLG